MGISTWRIGATTVVGISTWTAGAAATMGISTWRAGAATLWIASVEANAASAYNFHATHDKTNVIM
jgi:hypothetical protein